MDTDNLNATQFEALATLAYDALHSAASDANNSLEESAFLDSLGYSEDEIATAFDGNRNEEGEIDFDVTHDAADEHLSRLSVDEEITMLIGLGFSDETILVEIG